MPLRTQTHAIVAKNDDGTWGGVNLDTGEYEVLEDIPRAWWYYPLVEPRAPEFSEATILRHREDRATFLAEWYSKRRNKKVKGRDK